MNSAWRSGLFSSVGRSVFSSQARSFAEGSRAATGASAVVTVVVAALTLSLMVITHGLAPQFARVRVCTSKELTIPCYAKAKSGSKGTRRRSQQRRKRARLERLQLPIQPRAEKLPFSSIRKTLEEIFGADDLPVERAGDLSFAFDIAGLGVGDGDAIHVERAAQGALIVGFGLLEVG